MINLIIIRGLPGSGKSTFAKTAYPNYVHFEADQFFVDKAGIYNYDKSKIIEAHNWCFDSVIDTLTYDNMSVVVSNTFTRLDFIKRYLKYINAFGIRAEIHEMLGSYGSIHNVPEADMYKMKKAWQEIPTNWDIDVIKHY